jgi:hypothetical protein
MFAGTCAAQIPDIIKSIHHDKNWNRRLAAINAFASMASSGLVFPSYPHSLLDVTGRFNEALLG